MLIVFIPTLCNIRIMTMNEKIEDVRQSVEFGETPFRQIFNEVWQGPAFVDVSSRKLKQNIETSGAEEIYLHFLKAQIDVETSSEDLKKQQLTKKNIINRYAIHFLSEVLSRRMQEKRDFEWKKKKAKKQLR